MLLRGVKYSVISRMERELVRRLRFDAAAVRGVGRVALRGEQYRGS